MRPTGRYGRGRRVPKANSFGKGLKLSRSLFFWMRFAAILVPPEGPQRTRGPTGGRHGWVALADAKVQWTRFVFLQLRHDVE
jgi:hypothetical protein